MQKIAFSIIIFIFSFSSCFAENYLWDIFLNQSKEAKSIDGILRGESTLICRADGKTSPSPANVNNKKLALECASDLCGPADQVENYQEMVDKFEAMDVSIAEKDFIEEYDRLANQIFDSSLERNKKLQPIYKKITSEGKIEISKKGQSLSIMMKVITEGIGFVINEYNLPDDVSNPIFDFVEKDGRFTLELSEKKLKENLNKEFKNDPFNIRSAIETASRDKAYKALVLYASGVPVPAVLSELEGGDDWKETFRRLAVESNRQITLFQKKYGSYMDEKDLNFIEEEELKNIISGQFPKQEELADKLFSIYMLGFFTKALKNPEDYPEFFEKPNIQKMIVDKAKVFDWDKRLEGLSSVDKVSERKELDMAQCKAKRDLALAALPKKDQVDKLGKMISSTKDAFKHKLFSKFSQTSSKVLSTEIDKMNFIPPMTQGDYKKKILENMKETANEITEDIENLKKGSGPKYEGVLISNIPSSVEDDSFFDEESKLTKNTHDLMDDCDEYSLETLNDSFWPFKVGSIYISWNSARSKHFGHGVLHHELGHAISPFFKSGELSKKSSEKYKNTRACLNQNHGMENNADDQLYTEEDWADLVSSVIAEDSDKNMSCFLMSQTGNKYDSIHIHLKNSDEDDTHSADFFRILQVHLYRNDNYPKSCKEWLAKQTVPYPKENCRKEINKAL